MPRKLETAASKTAGVHRKLPRPTLPSPPTGSPIGWIHSVPDGFFPPSNLDKYGVVVTENPITNAAFRGVQLTYRTAITCQPAGSTNISQDRCLAAGYQMYSTTGQVMVNSSYQPSVLADPGLPAYQAEWCQAALTKAQQNGAEGMWIDDSNPRIYTISGGVMPQKYPTNALYEEAMLSFAQYVYNFFNSRGMKTGYNSGIAADDNAAAMKAWWPRLGPRAHYLSEEYWLTPNNAYLRLAGSSTWYNYWDEHRDLHRVCQQAGCGFIPNTDGSPDSRAQNYTLGTFMLDWDGTAKDGSNLFAINGYSTADPWNSYYTQAIALGAPTGPAVQTANNVWVRPFVNGSLTVNSGNGTTSISGV